MKRIADIRTDYVQDELNRSNLTDNPLILFQQWLAAAIENKVAEPTAMSLATVDNGRPTSRIVLLKEVSSVGFVFFTNYLSHKGMQLEANSFAALNFFWPQLQRQVRVEGTTQKVDNIVSDDYFLSRPIASRIGAWVSSQSSVIADHQIEEMRNRVRGGYLPQVEQRPPHWGGYLLIPDKIEFWQGGASRLHDRFLYTASENGAWQIDRLSP